MSKNKSIQYLLVLLSLSFSACIFLKREQTQLFIKQIGYLQFNTATQTIESVVKKKFEVNTRVNRIKVANYDSVLPGKYLLDSNLTALQDLKTFKFKFDPSFFLHPGFPERFIIYVKTEETDYYSYKLELTTADLKTGKILQFKFMNYYDLNRK